MDILDPSRKLPAPALSSLADAARRAAAVLGATGEVRVRIVGDAEMDRAHRQYKGIAGTTDVLTFDLTDQDPEPETAAPNLLDADILVCADEAARQAADRAGDLATELLLYIVHGMLHCLGYDDQTTEDAAAMHRREDEVLTAIGIGPVFEVPAAASGSGAAAGATGPQGGGAPWA